MELSILIAIMIAIVVGVNLIPTAAAVASESKEASLTLSSIIVYIFVVVVLLGAVAWMGFGETDDSSKEGPGRIMSIVQPYIREHRKLLLRIGVVSTVLLLLWLSTLGGYKP